MPNYNRNRPSRDREPSKTRSALGLMFNPNFGTSFSMLKDTGYMFIHMIAMIFSQADLIDKRHPAVVGEGKGKYGLFDIIMLAYERVEWRQENLAQIALFLAVCCCLGIVGLSIVYALFAIVFSSV